MARRADRRAVAAVIVIALSALPALQAAELPITKNFPISDFQNRPQDVTPYDFDAPPQGLFLTITTAEGFDEELGFHRTHEIVPVKPTGFVPIPRQSSLCSTSTSIIRGSRYSDVASRKR